MSSTNDSMSRTPVTGPPASCPSAPNSTAAGRPLVNRSVTTLSGSWYSVMLDAFQASGTLSSDSEKTVATSTRPSRSARPGSRSASTWHEPQVTDMKTTSWGRCAARWRSWTGRPSSVDQHANRDRLAQVVDVVDDGRVRGRAGADDEYCGKDHEARHHRPPPLRTLEVTQRWDHARAADAEGRRDRGQRHEHDVAGERGRGDPVAPEAAEAVALDAVTLRRTRATRTV